jgi:penicillin-binding protein 1B
MPQPDNVVQAWVDSHTGQGSDANCPGAVQMPYIRGSEPPPGAACGGEGPASGETVMDWVKGWMN